MCGFGAFEPLIIILSPPLLWMTIKEHSNELASKTSTNSKSLFSKLNPDALQQKEKNITRKISLVSTTKVYGENNQYKLSQYYYKRAVYKLLSRNFADAQKDLQESVQLYNQNFRALHLQANIQFMLGNFVEAAATYMLAFAAYDAFNTKIKSIPQLENVSQTMNKLENFGIAARDKLNSIFSSMVISKTGSLKKSMQQQSAESQEHLAILEMFEEQTKHITKADVLNSVGVCYMNAIVDNLDEAIANFNKAIELSGEDVKKKTHFAFNLSLSLFYDRQFRAALDTLNSLVCPGLAKISKGTTSNAIEPFNVLEQKAYKLRGYLNSYFGNTTESEQDYSKVAVQGQSSLKDSFYYRLLPEGVVTIVFSFLPVTDLIRVLTVSRHVNKLASAPILWPIIKARMPDTTIQKPDFTRYSLAKKMTITSSYSFGASCNLSRFLEYCSTIAPNIEELWIHEDYSYSTWISAVTRLFTNLKILKSSGGAKLYPYDVMRMNELPLLQQATATASTAADQEELMKAYSKIQNAKFQFHVSIVQ